MQKSLIKRLKIRLHRLELRRDNLCNLILIAVIIVSTAFPVETNLIMTTVSFITLGCKVNQYETQAIREQFAKAGLKEVASNQKADIYIVNTCTVTSQADRESLKIIRRFIKFNPHPIVVATGCLVERDAEVLRSIPGIDFVMGNSLKDRIAKAVLQFDADCHRIFPQITADNPQRPVFLPLRITSFKDHSRAFVKIQDGCSNSCSYCKVPLVRGPSRSRALNDIKTEVVTLLKKDFKEIVLVGVCLGSYGLTLVSKLSLVDCLDEIETIKGDFRIRLSSIEPKDVNESLIKKMLNWPKLCRHLHLPFQSGDDEILKKMNRSYCSSDYKKLVERVRRAIPGIAITTDILVGFPGEKDKNFKNTLNFIEEIKPSRVHLFGYSKREGTAASHFKEEIPLKIIRERIDCLREIALDSSRKFRQNFLNKTLRVLVEARRDKKTGLLKGYSDNYIRIFLDGSDELINHFVWVKIVRVTSHSTYAVSLL